MSNGERSHNFTPDRTPGATFARGLIKNFLIYTKLTKLNIFHLPKHIAVLSWVQYNSRSA